MAAHLTGMLGTLHALPLTYNKDMQEDKEHLFDAVDTLLLVLPAVTGMVATMKVNAARDTASRLKALGNIWPTDIGLEIPQNGEPRTGLSMGEHAALTALEWQIAREALAVVRG